MVILRFVRFFKLARYSPALRSLANALLPERHAVGASPVIIFGVVMLAATVMYMVEREVQPKAFGTIPVTVWWAMTTVTAVGYGYGLLALPIGIVAVAFAREIHSRDFAVTWGMVARVPPFPGPARGRHRGDRPAAAWPVGQGRSGDQPARSAENRRPAWSSSPRVSSR